MNNPIVTGILSFGMSGRVFHAPFVSTNPFFKLHSVTERHVKKAKIIYPDIISYNNVDELLANKEIELVIINTPNNTHYAFAKQALLSGKHVLIEKPAAANVAELKELYTLAISANLKIFVYQNRRWDCDFQEVKDVIESKKIGNIIEAHFRYDRYRPSLSKKLFKEINIPASGLSFDLGPHILDQVISLFGKPEHFTKTLETHRPDSVVDDYFHIHLKYAEGKNIFITGSLMSLGNRPAYVIQGSKGVLIQYRTDPQEDQLQEGILPNEALYGIAKDVPSARLTTIDENGSISESHLPPRKGDYNELFNAIFQTIRKGKEFPIKTEDILYQLEILES